MEGILAEQQVGKSGSKSQVSETESDKDEETESSENEAAGGLDVLAYLRLYLSLDRTRR